MITKTYSTAPKKTFLKQYNKIKTSYKTGSVSVAATLEKVEWLIHKSYNSTLVDNNFNKEEVRAFYCDIKNKSIKHEIDRIKSFLQGLGFLQNKKHSYSLRYIKTLCKRLSKEYGKAKDFLSFCHHYNLK